MLTHEWIVTVLNFESNSYIIQRYYVLEILLSLDDNIKSVQTAQHKSLLVKCLGGKEYSWFIERINFVEDASSGLAFENLWFISALLCTIDLCRINSNPENVLGTYKILKIFLKQKICIYLTLLLAKRVT